MTESTSHIVSGQRPGLLRCNSLPPDLLRHHQNLNDGQYMSDIRNRGETRQKFGASLDSRFSHADQLNHWFGNDWKESVNIGSEGIEGYCSSVTAEIESVKDSSEDINHLFEKDKEQSLDLLKNIWKMETKIKQVKVQSDTKKVQNLAQKKPLKHGKQIQIQADSHKVILQTGNQQDKTWTNCRNAIPQTECQQSRAKSIASRHQVQSQPGNQSLGKNENISENIGDTSNLETSTRNKEHHFCDPDGKNRMLKSNVSASDSINEESDKSEDEDIKNNFFVKTTSNPIVESSVVNRISVSFNNNYYRSQNNSFDPILVNTNANKDSSAVSGFQLRLSGSAAVGYAVTKRITFVTEDSKTGKDLFSNRKGNYLLSNENAMSAMPPSKPPRLNLEQKTSSRNSLEEKSVLCQDNDFKSSVNENAKDESLTHTPDQNSTWQKNSGYNRYQRNTSHENYPDQTTFSDNENRFQDSDVMHGFHQHGGDFDSGSSQSEDSTLETFSDDYGRGVDFEKQNSGNDHHNTHYHHHHCSHHHHCCHHHHHHFNHKPECPAARSGNHGDHHTSHAYYSRKQEQMAHLTEMMETLAESAGFEIHDVTPDGNCMFRSIIDQLRMHGELDITAPSLRKNAVEYLKANPCHEDGTHLQEFLPTENWDDYLERMKRDGEWGDQIMLRGISEVTGRRICIISAIGDSHNQINIQPSKAEADQSENIFLGHMDDLHYVSLRPKNWQDTWFVNARTIAQKNQESCRFMTDKGEEPQLPRQDEGTDEASGLPFYHSSFIFRNVLNEKYLYTGIISDTEYFERDNKPSKDFKRLAVGSVMEKFAVSVYNTSPFKPSYSLSRSQFKQNHHKLPNYIACHLSFEVVFNGRDVTRQFAYIALVTDVHPGYLRLQPIFPVTTIESVTWVNGHIPCLNNSFNQSKMNDKLSKKQSQGNPHHSSENIESSVISAFWTREWPESALCWLTRERPSGWPKPELMQEVINDGCLIVPFPHPESKIPDCEWRFSFANTEKKLALSISKRQRYCFHIFKVLVDFIVGNEDILSTYFLKTVFFHVCEIIERRQWHISPSSCVFYLLDWLLQCLKSKQLPHYFISENNIIDHFSTATIEHLINRITGLRQFPAHSAVLLAESCGLPSASLADPILEDLKNFRNHRNAYRSAIEVMVPTLFGSAQNYLKYNMYEPATSVVKQAHVELKFAISSDCTDMHEAMTFHVFVQQFISSLDYPQKFWFCFFLDYYHGTLSTDDLTRNQIGCHTVKELAGNSDDDGEFDHIQVPECILDHCKQTMEIGGLKVSFMSEFCRHLLFAGLYQENAHYLRCFIKLIEQELKNQPSAQADTTEKTSSNKEALDVGATNQKTAKEKNYNDHIVVSTFSQMLQVALIGLFQCYNQTGQVELFQEYIENLEDVCDRIPSTSSYQHLANVWTHLGNREKAQIALNKKDNLKQ